MRVYLDVDSITPEPSGIGFYTAMLAAGLRQDSRVSGLELCTTTSGLAVGSGMRPLARLNRLGRQVLERTYQIVAKVARPRNIFHGPNYFLPEHVDDGVITIHDLSVFRYPETHPLKRVNEFEKRFNESVNRASVIITDTIAVKNELKKYLGSHQKTIRSVSLASGPSFYPRYGTEVDKVLAKWGLRAGYYGLSVSTLEPRKRIRELVQAWSNLSPITRSRFPLVLCGSNGWHMESFERDMLLAEKDGWLIRTGYVHSSQLPALYSGTRVFLYPSLYEGFGLPPLEAMACGAQTIISNEASLMEVAGDSAIVCDPEDHQSFVSAIERSLMDDEQRTMMQAMGIQRAQRFSWDRTITSTVDVYSEWFEMKDCCSER